MREILKIAFRDLHLEQVIWCVSRMNVRANKFYQKNNFKLCNSVPDEMKELYNGVPDLLWYGVNKNEIDFFD